MDTSGPRLFWPILFVFLKIVFYEMIVVLLKLSLAKCNILFGDKQISWILLCCVKPDPYTVPY